MEILINFSRICSQSLVLKVSRICSQSLVLKISFYRSEFGSSGLKMTDFGLNGQDLVLVLVNFLRFLL